MGYDFLLCSRGPKSDLGCAGPCGVCRAVTRLAANMLGYAGKTLVRRKMGEKVLSRYLFSRVTGLFLLGPVAPKKI